jgi:U3 small nucleolar RNA-associated protein 15
MADYVPLEIVKFPRKPIFEASQSRIWKNYKNTFLRQDHSAITNIAVSESLYAVTASARVRFFTYDNSNKFSLTRFRNTTIGGCFRNDGELFAAGDIEGSVNLFQVSTKTLLRSYKHEKPAYGCAFVDKTHLVTGSDDFYLNFWDISQKKVIWKVLAHDDYPRAVESIEDLIVSAGMDSKLKLWSKSGELVKTYDHGSPLSSLLSSGPLLISSGHVSYKVWDIRQDQAIFSSTPHSKNITSMSFNSNISKFLTSSIDCSLKIHNLSDFSVEYTLKYPEPILSAKLSPNDSHLIVGMADGKLSVRQNKTKSKLLNQVDPTEALYLKKWEEFHAKLPEETVKNYRYFNRGVFSKQENDEIVADNEYKKKIREYDILFRKFRYGEVLDLAFDTDRVDLTISILQELALRNGLQDALIARDPATICKVLAWICKKIHNPKYSSTVLPLALLVCDMYSALTDINAALLNCFKKLLKEVEEEFKQQTQALEVVGIIDYLIPE